MNFSKKQKMAFLNSYLQMMDMAKKEKKEVRRLRTGSSLLAEGITQVGIEKVKPDKTYNAKYTVTQVPDHKSNIIIIIDNAKGQSDLEDKLAAYLVIWGLPQFYNKQSK